MPLNIAFTSKLGLTFKYLKQFYSIQPTWGAFLGGKSNTYYLNNTLSCALLSFNTLFVVFYSVFGFSIYTKRSNLEISK